jgi:hypothetical protein
MTAHANYKLTVIFNSDIDVAKSPVSFFSPPYFQKMFANYSGLKTLASGKSTA